MAAIFNTAAMPVDAWAKEITAYLPADMSVESSARDGIGYGVEGYIKVRNPNGAVALKAKVQYGAGLRKVYLHSLHNYMGRISGQRPGIQFAWRVACHARDHGYTHMSLHAAHSSGSLVWTRAAFEIEAAAMKTKEVIALNNHLQRTINCLEGVIAPSALQTIQVVQLQMDTAARLGIVLPGTEGMLAPLADLRDMVTNEEYKAKNKCDSHFDSPMNRAPSVSIAGYALLNTKWRGIMRFDDEEQMAKFEAYANPKPA